MSAGPTQAPFRRRMLAALVCLGALATGAGAQPAPRVERSAPRGTADLTLAWATIEIEYGRPEARGSAVFGERVPFDRIWRLGADEATRLTVSTDVALGSLTVPAGSYALFAIPHAHSWTLVVNRVAQQWGAWNWDATQDVGRVEASVEAADPPVPSLTMELVATAEKEGELAIAWAGVRARWPLRVLGEPPPPPPPPAKPGVKPPLLQ